MRGPASLQSGRLAAGLALMLLALPAAGLAQQAGGSAVQAPRSFERMPVLTIESERLFANSQFGQRVAQQLEADSIALATENRGIEAELSAEEEDLTARRPQMTPEEFRALANAFDQKVQAIRREQDAKARDLSRRTDEARLEFFNAARPVLTRLMQERGAAVIIERRGVFLSRGAIDITDAAIDAVDAILGDGNGAPVPAPQPPAPAAQGDPGALPLDLGTPLPGASGADAAPGPRLPAEQ